MTPDEEIERIKKDYKSHWHLLERNPGIQKAIAEKSPVKLGEMAALLVYGNYQDKDVAHRDRHPVIAIINSQPMEFDTVESAKKYIEHKKASDPSLEVGDIFKRTDDGRMELISN